jgi:hypothetical protein
LVAGFVSGKRNFPDKAAASGYGKPLLCEIYPPPAMLNILLPSLPYERTIDPMWQEELETAQQQGYNVCLFDAEQEKIYRPLQAQWPTLYRGWMLTAAEYRQLERLTPLLVSAEMYLASHQATGWYESVAEFTPRSQFIAAKAGQEAVAAELHRAGRCFIKCLSKSFGADSVIHSLEEYETLLSKHAVDSSEELFVREFVELSAAPERRFFAVHHQAFGADGAEFPAALTPALEALQARRFYTIDVAYRPNGQPIIIEVGDGQVSDTKEWTLAGLYEKVMIHLP